MKLSYVLAAIVTGAGLSTPVRAATISTDENTTGYSVSATDLLQTSLLSLNASAGFDAEGVAGEPALRDGGFGPQGGQNSNPKPMAAATAGQGQTVTYTLNTSVNTAGYDITDVNSYAGWDGARYGQKYDVSFHIVGASAGTFTTPIAVDYEPGTLNGSNNNTRVLVSGVGASNVDQVQFVFHDAASVPAGGYQGYRELDVLGSPSAVPEPTSIGLLGLAALGLTSRRRRHA